MILEKPFFRFARCIAAEAAGIIGTIGAAAINAASQAITNAQNRKQAEDAYRKQQEAVRQANEYNSASQQVLRMKVAGLNPSLAYGADGSLTGNQSEIPSMTPIPAEAPMVPDFGAAARDASRLGLEVREQNNRDMLAPIEAKLKDSQAWQAVKVGDLSAEQCEVLAKTLQPNLDKLIAETREINSRQDLNRSSIRVNESLIKKNRADAQAAYASAGCSEAMTNRILTLIPHEVLQMDSDARMKYWLSEQGAAQSAHILQSLMTDREYLKLAWEHYNIDLEQLGINSGYLGIAEQDLDLHKKQFAHQQAIDWATFGEQTVMDISNAALGWATFGISGPVPTHPAPKVGSHYGGARVQYGQNVVKPRIKVKSFSDMMKGN